MINFCRSKADLTYALGTVYFMCCSIALFIILHALSRYSPPALKRTRLWRKGEAVIRYLSYRGFQLRSMQTQWWSPSIGVFIVLLAGFVFFMAMTLGPHPYYWPNTANFGNSPPLATRTGWMALALLPFGMYEASCIIPPKRERERGGERNKDKTDPIN